MSRTVSPSSGRPYGLARVCRVWRAARASVYRHLSSSRPKPPRRPDPVGPMPDAAVGGGGPRRPDQEPVSPASRRSSRSARRERLQGRAASRAGTGIAVRAEPARLRDLSAFIGSPTAMAARWAGPGWGTRSASRI